MVQRVGQQALKVQKLTTVALVVTVSPEGGSGFNEVPESDSTSKWARNPNQETKQTLKLKEILYFQMLGMP